MRQRALLFVVFSFCIFLLLLAWGIGFVTKTQDVPFVQTIFNPVQYAFIRLFHQTTPTTALDKLKAENISLQKQTAKMHLLEADNKALRDQFQTTNPASQNLMPVAVIGMPGFIPGVTVPDFLIISAGAKDGVTDGQAVVYKDLLIGTITALHPRSAKVQLLTAANVSFAAKTATTGALGIVKGFGNGQVELDNVVLSDTLTVGDMVVSGADAQENGKGIPPGLIIGKITSIDKKSSNLFQKANIQVLTDVTRLSEVFLVVQP